MTGWGCGQRIIVVKNVNGGQSGGMRLGMEMEEYPDRSRTGEAGVQIERRLVS